MDLYQELNNEHSKASRERIISYVNNDPERFAELFGFVKHDNAKINLRAAWSLSSCAERFPDLVSPYINEIVHLVDREGNHDGIKRNMLRILQRMKIPEELEGRLLNSCFRLLTDKREAVAIRVFSMQVLANLSQLYQDIRPELKIIIEDELPYARPAFVSRGQKILKKLDANSRKREQN